MSGSSLSLSLVSVCVLATTFDLLYLLSLTGDIFNSYQKYNPDIYNTSQVVLPIIYRLPASISF